MVPFATASAVNLPRAVPAPPTAAPAISPSPSATSANFVAITSYPPAAANQSLACMVIPEAALAIATTCAPPGISAATILTPGLVINSSHLLSFGGLAIHIIVYSPTPPLPSLVSINLPFFLR